MSDRLLTPGSRGEVAALTGGHTRRVQVRVLRQNGIRHILNAAGWPVVPWSAVDGTAPSSQDAKPWRSRALDDAA